MAILIGFLVVVAFLLLFGIGILIWAMKTAKNADNWKDTI